MENPLKGKYDIGVVVGRFQVPGLTDGHRHLIDNVNDAHKQLILVVGISPTLGTKKNSLGYTPRMQMLREAYPNAIITHILDVGSDELWSKNLDTIVRSLCPIGSICFYGGRDSFINSYTGVYNTFELGAPDTIDGTKVRENIGKEVIDSYEFRAGIIHSCQNQYPKVFPTVDVAVLKKVGKGYEILMGKRTPESGWRFPGGFVDPTDATMEEAAIRELYEEVDVSVDHDSIQYVCTNRQNDKRYPGRDEVITTTLYKVDYIYGGHTKDKNELCQVGWVPVNIHGFAQTTSTHRHLFIKLLSHLKISTKLPKGVTIEGVEDGELNTVN